MNDSHEQILKAIFKRLLELKVETVEVEFDGSGDDGQIQDMDPGPGGFVDGEEPGWVRG